MEEKAISGYQPWWQHTAYIVRGIWKPLARDHKWGECCCAWVLLVGFQWAFVWLQWEQSAELDGVFSWSTRALLSLVPATLQSASHGPAKPRFLSVKGTLWFPAHTNHPQAYCSITYRKNQIMTFLPSHNSSHVKTAGDCIQWSPHAMLLAALPRDTFAIYNLYFLKDAV